MELVPRWPEDSRSRLVDAAMSLFGEHGYSGTTVDEIAKAAGVSASTFFRHFKTKEESILAVDLEIDAEIDAWLEAVAPPEVDLAGMEAIYARAAARLVEASDGIKSRVLRTRRLIVGDAHLRSAAMALDATTLCRLADVVADKLGGREFLTPARLLVEAAGMTLRIAFDEWATRVDAGEDADFGEIYANARAELRRVVR